MHTASTNERTSIWITGNQCSLRNSALASANRERDVILLIESTQRAQLQRYHKRKLVLIYAVMRHFADDLRREGWTVDYHAEADDYAGPLQRHIAQYAPSNIRFERQAEYGLSEAMIAVAKAAGVPAETTAHSGVLSTERDYDRWLKGESGRVTMETFYRGMRRKTGLLMDGDAPLGGAWNFDAENRQPPKAGLRFPAPPRYEPDATTRAVIAFVEARFPNNPGIVGDFALPVTRADALDSLERFAQDRLPTFGPWQDAMVAGERTMSHSLLSSSLNCGLLDPGEVAVRAARAFDDGAAPLASVEGFIRQIIGWREYIWRVYWKRMPDYKERNALGADHPLPTFFWDGETQMFCMREALSHVLETAYAHHILRLMILGNFALIAGLAPLETNDWFWSMFIDGYDWVMAPNVIGMTLHADGGEVGTKPYAASANYINKMSDYCARCRYDPKKLDGDDACPFNALYWDFLGRNEAHFARNARMSIVMRAYARRDDAWKARVKARADEVRRRMLEQPSRL